MIAPFDIFCQQEVSELDLHALQNIFLISYFNLF
jgi:hypothetical protein